MRENYGIYKKGQLRKNTVDGIVQTVNEFIRSKTEATNYSGRTAEESKDFSEMFIQLMGKSNLIIEGKCYIGITADPIESLTAHGIDMYSDNSFFCMDIPSEDAAECRKAIAETGGFEPYFDENSDFIDNTYDQLYIYIYKISDKTTEKIDVKGFTPLKQIPDRPIRLQMTFTDGNTQSRIYDEFSQKECNELISELKVLTEDNKLTELNITHRELNSIHAEFGIGCCIINYASGTSQCGGYQSYRSGERARKKAQLFTREYPEYMLCRDFSVLENILRHFLMKGTKPGKRQNVKWFFMKEEY